MTAVLTDFSFVGATQVFFICCQTFMQKYNPLPNDAIILATCKIHNITKLASRDSDFIYLAPLRELNY